MDKKQLRLKMLETRRKMPESALKHANEVILAKAVEVLEKLRPAKVHCYSSIAAKREVETDSILEFLENSDFVETIQTFRKLNGEWLNVSINTNKIDLIEMYDVIIVPMLAGDKLGNRLGYGSGFYDKFLSSQPTAVKLGLCFKENIEDKLLSEPHDIRMNIVITG